MFAANRQKHEAFIRSVVKLSKSSSLKKGFLYGAIFFSFHLLWFLKLLITHGKSCLVYPFWLLTVCCLALFTGIWLWLQQQLYHRYPNDIGWIVSWVISTVLYCYFVTYCSLFICGICEGYPFFNPLVLLARWPQLLWCLKYLGFTGTLTCLLLVVCTIWKRYFVCSFIFALPFLLGFIFYQPCTVQLCHTQFIKPWWHRSKDPMYVGYRMVHDVTKAMHNNKTLKAIVMPESSFGWDMYEYKQFVSMMCDYSDKVSILFGGQRCIGGQLRNSYFAVRDGQIIFTYDKQHLVPLMERVPQFLDCLYCGELLCRRNDVFAYGDQSNDIVEVNGVRFQLFICSELLHEAKPVKGLPILFVCNDAWFKSDWIKKWIILFIKYFELRYDVPVLFGTVEGLTNIEP